MNTTEHRIYHVARKCAGHNFELDDRVYGSPLPKTGTDWPLENPELYLKRVDNELRAVETALDDVAYLLREKGQKVAIPEKKVYALEEADAYVFHKFNVRQFEYAEKLSSQLCSKMAEQINVKIPKARRQFNVLLAAREDLLVTKVRFEEYLKNYKEDE